jgi:hypothetical protein
MRVVEGRLLGVAASVAALVVCMAIWGASTSGAHRGGHAPDVIQLSYSETKGDVGADNFLGVFARHTHRMKFSIQLHRIKSRAPGRYREDITDTDIHGRQARHPWVPDRKEGGKGVITKVHRALNRRGHISLRVRAWKGGVVDDVRVRINRDKCSSTPAYPLDCEVKVD